MFRAGGGGNDPEFLRWLLVRIVWGLAWRIAWRGLSHYPRKLIHHIKRLRD